MGSSFLLALREGIEAALVVGIVLGALRKLNMQQGRSAVWWGVAAGVGVSVLAAIGLNSLGLAFEGQAEVIFEGFMMLIAAGFLTWMIFWMQKHGRHMKAELEAGVKEAAAGQNTWALFLLTFTAVMREGIELALFLLAARMVTNPAATLIGSLLGLLTAIGLGWLLFASTRNLNLQRFFQVTNVLLVLFAAGLVAHGVHEFNEAGWIPSVVEHLWDLNPILDEKGTFGRLLGALFGYNGNPSLTEVLSYLIYLLGLGFVFGQQKRLPQTQKTIS
jgi:high-affinity iron transporter